ncbi:MAG: phosphoribosyltransferase family protein, partial [bacterium]|nr:phosphoribosyltransferase family protein [bacterium]
LGKSAITLSSEEHVYKTCLLIYTKLQRIAPIHQLLKIETSARLSKPVAIPALKPLSRFNVISQAWETGMDEYAAIMALKKKHNVNNFSFPLLGRTVVYLETFDEVKKVLEAKSFLGQVYRQFSLAAGLKHDFVANDMNDARSYRQVDGSVNIWRLVHAGFAYALKNDKQSIENLIDKYLEQIFFAEKSFSLDTTFDAFFSSFWSEYLFGNHVSLEAYQENRQHILDAMKYCFYDNKCKSIDPTGLSSFFYSYAVRNELAEAKMRIKTFIAKSTPNSLVNRFKSFIEQINQTEELELGGEIIQEIIADNVFDLIFEPDFLENVIYEALVCAIRENADFREVKAREEMYNQGMHKGYLFPIRSRVLQEPITLKDGTELAKGSMVYLNMRDSGVYHSAGARRCVGQAYTNYFKEHLFNRLQSVEFKVKDISYPEERQSKDKNVPVSPERYHVSWRMKRDEAMHHMPFHDYKGKQFFDVLSLYQKPAINSQITQQLILNIKSHLEKEHCSLNDFVIATSEVRGIPAAAQIAKQFNVPLYIIRKKGGYKMAAEEVYREEYNKGYGDPDEVELPIQQIKSLEGKNVIFLDDGIASGQSALACVNLLEKKCNEDKEPAKVTMVLALLKHDYVKTDPKLAEHRLVKTLFNCTSKVSPEKTPVVRLEMQL